MGIHISFPRFETRNSKVLIALIAVLGISLIALLYSFFRSSENKTATSPTSNPVPTPVMSQASQLAPIFSAEKYTQPRITSPVPSGLRNYALKNNFTQEEVINFGQRFQLAEVDSRGGVFVMSNTLDNKGYMTFDTSIGSFTFRSFGEHTFSQVRSSDTYQMAATKVLEQIGVNDSTITCPVTYKYSDSQAVTFVECHRDWSRMSAPLTNLAGVLNLSESRNLSSMRAGQTFPESPDNAAIIQVVGGENGKARPNDYNTITIGFYEDKSIYSIDSTLRWVAESVAIPPSELLSPQEALAAFSQGTAEFSLTLPLGSGDLEFAKVYPGNKASATIASVSELTIAYLDKPITTSQSEYTPSYIIKGTAQLGSGYPVKFVSTIPAMKSRLSVKYYNGTNLAERNSSSSSSVAGVSTLAQGRNPQLQLGTFSPAVTRTPDEPIPPETPPKVCYEGEDSHDITLNVPGYGQLVVSTGQQEISHTFFLKSTSGNAEMREVVSAFLEMIQEQYLINVARWWMNHPTAVSQINTVSEVVALYDTQNGVQQGYGLTTCKDPDAPSPAPFISAKCTANSDGGKQYLERSTSMGHQVAQTILNARAANSLQQIASRDDIFPPITIKSMHLSLFSGPAGSRKCYISGATPTVIIYNAPNNTTVKPSFTTHSYPALTSSSWKTQSEAEVFYYEYEASKAWFEARNLGYIVNKEDLSILSDHISRELHLTPAESRALNFELSRAASSVNATKLTILPVDEKEAMKKLPLIFSNKPDLFYRYHFVIKEFEGERLEEPKFKKIKRSGFTAIEFGSQAQ